jgi:hypothetical protein
MGGSLGFGGMNGFAAGKHFHKLANSLSSRFRALGSVHAIDKRISVGAIEVFKRKPGFRICG